MMILREKSPTSSAMAILGVGEKGDKPSVGLCPLGIAKGRIAPYALAIIRRNDSMQCW